MLKKRQIEGTKIFLHDFISISDLLMILLNYYPELIIVILKWEKNIKCFLIDCVIFNELYR